MKPRHPAEVRPLEDVVHDPADALPQRVLLDVRQHRHHYRDVAGRLVVGDQETLARREQRRDVSA